MISKISMLFFKKILSHFITVRQLMGYLRENNVTPDVYKWWTIQTEHDETFKRTDVVK